MHKSKRKPSPPANRFVYALLWAGCLAVAGWLLNNVSLVIMRNLRPSTEQLEIISVLIGTLVLALVQVVVTERVLKRSMRNWLVYTFLGALCVLLWSDLFPWSALQTPRAFLSSIGWMWIPVFEMVWLWRRVRYAWLWPVAQVALSQVMRLLLPFSGPLHLPVIMLYSFPQQFVLGLVMYFLWSHVKPSEKAKINAADITNEDEARVKRLQETDRHGDLWEQDNNRALHNKA
jgi:hypothetical protein